jgi:orotate phosphoribosyltransferase
MYTSTSKNPSCSKSVLVHSLIPFRPPSLPPSPSPGTAIRESVEILNAAGAHLVAVAVSLDRQEKATDTSTESAIQVREHSRPALSQLEAQLVEPHHSLLHSALHYYRS